ncbi:MAG: GntR family transcriptional regulator [Pseudomonadota bacterium]|nr:GntR family transcriptional regulator [Pseudomonadota bacterium]MEC8483740.1 GntR family transcriptional regulator [Pseudomonadota bacterium]
MADFLYKGVVDWFLQQMSQGELSPGDKMPSLRKLAKQLELSLNTVIHGYDILAEEGWIESRPKSGYFVCHKPTVKHAHLLAGDRAVRFDEALSKKLAWSALSHRAALVDQSDDFLHPSVRQGETDLPVLGKGHLAVREAVSEHLRKVAINVHPSQIWLGRSPLAMYTQAVQTLTQVGDAVLVITPCDPRLTSTLISLGRDVVTLAAGERGVDLDEAVRCLRDDAIKMVVFPSQFGFPGGSEISNLSLRRWLAIVQQLEIPAIEWDMTSHLSYKPSTLMTYKSLDEKNQIVYIGGVESKGVDRNAAWCLPGKYQALEGALLCADLALSDPQQQALMDALQPNQRHSLMRRARQIWSVAEKSKSLLEGALGDTVRFANAKGGLTLWLQLDTALTEAQLTTLFAKHRHGLVPGSYLSAQAEANHWLAVNVTYEGIEKLAAQLRSCIDAAQQEQAAVASVETDEAQSEVSESSTEVTTPEALDETLSETLSVDEVMGTEAAEDLGQEVEATYQENEVNAETEAAEDVTEANQKEENGQPEPAGMLLEPSDFAIEDVMLKQEDEVSPDSEVSQKPDAEEKPKENSTKTVYNPMLDLINHDFG